MDNLHINNSFEQESQTCSPERFNAQSGVVDIDMSRLQLILKSTLPRNSSYMTRLFGETCDTEELVYAHINLFYRMKECKTLTNFILTIHSYYKDILGHHKYGDFTRQYEKYILIFIALCFGVQTTFLGPKSDHRDKLHRFVAQSDTDKNRFKQVLSDLRSYLSDKDRVLNSDFAQKFGQFCSLLVCTPFFVKMGVDATTFGFSDVLQNKLKKQYQKKHIAELSLSILDGAVYILDKVSLYLETGNRSAFFIDDKEVADYEEQYTKLSHYSDLPSSMANMGWSVRDYLTECDLCIERGKKLLAFFANDKFKVSVLKNQQAQLSRFKLRAMDKLQVLQEREAPLGFCFYGPPGVGKSALIDKFMHCLYQNERDIKGEGKSYDPSLKYMYNEDDEYFSEFKVSHEICVIDDVDQFKDEINVQKKGGAMAKAIYLINPIPYMTNQAALEDKGMIPFMCRYVVATTNTYDGGISKIFRPQGGAYRRFVFVEVSVKPEFCKPGTTQLRGDISDEGYKNHDLHNFRVRMYQSNSDKSRPVYYNKSTDKFVTNRNVPFMSMGELSHFMYHHVQKPHYRQNNLTKKSVEHFLNMELCDECKNIGEWCKCAKAQSHFSIEEELLSQPSRDMIGYIASLVMLFHLFYVWFLYITHLIIEKASRNDRPNWATKKLIAHVKNMPNQFRLPKWFLYVPNWALSYFLCEYWHNWLHVKCQQVSEHGLLMTSYCQSRDFRRKVFKFATLVGIFAIVSRIVTTYVCLSSSQSLFEDDETKSEVKNVWKVKYQDISKLNSSCTTISYDELSSRIEKNICQLVAKIGNGHNAFTNALGYKGNLMFVPLHWYTGIKEHFPIRLDIIREDVQVTAGPNRYDVLVDENNFVHVSTHNQEDVILLQISAVGTFRDISKFIPNQVMDGKMEGQLIVRKRNGELSHRKVKAFHKTLVYYKSESQTHQYLGYEASVSEETNFGDCGAPYIIKAQNGVYIGGIHIAGRKASGLLRPLTYICPLHNWDYISRTFVPASYDGIDLNKTYLTTEDLQVKPVQHRKCPIRSTKGGTLQIYGSINSHRRAIKTQVCDTLMCEDVLQHYNLLETKHIAPRGISSHQAAVNNLEPMFDKPTFPQKYVDRAQDALYEWYSREIELCDIDMPSGPLDLDSAINGIDGIAYMERMPLKTSGGFAHKGSKSKYLELCTGDENHEVLYRFKNEIQSEYDNMLHNYREGKRSNIIWDFNFKDEPITHEKLAKQKCRIFNSGPCAFIALERQFYLWCIPFFSGRFRHKFGMAIGANCFSNDWKTLYEYVTQHGENQVIAGDYSKFDKRMSSQMMLAAFNVLVKLMRDAGWHEEDIQVAIGIATDICYPVSNAFGTIIETDGSNPSGHSLTTVINGMVNIMYIMIACMEIEDKQGINYINYDYFPRYCSILTYGDDNCMSCKYKWMNHVAISAALDKYGVVYTSADKKSKLVPFINARDLDFLKRKFMKDVHGEGTIACPLDEDSILKMLTVVVKSNTITFDQQCAEVILAANREYFQYGKGVCNAKKEFLDYLVDKYDLRPYLPEGVLYDYDTFHCKIFDNN
jgi:hypothetical protein